MMHASSVIFYLIAAFILVTAFLSVSTGKIFRAAIWLLFSLMGIAGLYFWLEVEFIAAVQIVIYVGGIVVLIIFSIFLTQQSGKDMPHPSPARIVASVLAVLCGFSLIYALIYQYGFTAGNTKFDPSVARIGSGLMGMNDKGYTLPFEVVSMLLLAVMIGCIVIAMKSPKKE